MATTVEIGHNVRRWTTFEIKDATAEEVALLHQYEQGDYNEAVFSMLAAMDAAGRLVEVEFSIEQNAEVFSEHVDPNIIGVDDATSQGGTA
jgi:hypothetical protein